MKAAFLRTVRSRPLWLLALLIAAALPLMGLIRPTPVPEGAAFCITGEAIPAADALALRQRLGALGFAEAEDETALRSGVLAGDWGCALLLEGDCARFLQAENAANPALWRGAAAAALFSVEAPYFTERALEQAGVPGEGARARYDALYAAGSPFAVRLETVEGRAPVSTLTRDKVLMAGAAACLLGAVFGAALPAWADAALLRRRGCSRRVCLGQLCAQLTLRFALLAAATALGAALAGQGGLCPRLLLYLLLCLLLAVLALGLTRRPGAVSVAAALLCLLIPVLCPVYADLSLTLPQLAPVQRLFLPWWLYYRLPL